MVVLCLIISGGVEAQRIGRDWRSLSCMDSERNSHSLELRSTSTALKDSIVHWWGIGTENETKWKVVYKYTPEGWLEGYEQLTWDNEKSNWSLDYTESYTRDELGRKTTYKAVYSWGTRVEEEYTWEGNKGIVKQVTSFDDPSKEPQYAGLVEEVDDERRIIKSAYSPGKKDDADDTNWVFTEINSYEFDDQGRRTKWEIVQYDGLENSESYTQTTTSIYEGNKEIWTTVTQNFLENTTSTTTGRTEKKEGNPEEYSTYGSGGMLSSKEYYYYPKSSGNSGSFMKSDNNIPVGSDNKGSFDITIDLPLSSVSGAFFIVGMPEGFELDTKNTILVTGSDQYELALTKQEENNWTFEMSAKSLRSLREVSGDVSATVLVHVAYLVDDVLEKGSYDVGVNELRFITPAGNMIYGIEEMTVPVTLDRLATGLENIQISEVQVSCNGQTWTIDSPVNEMIYIYTITGVKVYQGAKPVGKITLTLPELSGVMIVKGGSNWVKKVQIR